MLIFFRDIQASENDHASVVEFFVRNGVVDEKVRLLRNGLGVTEW